MERARVMFRLQHLYEQHLDELGELVVRENGKSIQEGRGEVRRGIDVIEFAAGMPTLMQGGTVEHVSRGVDTELFRHPLGVVAAITPFNFPCMVPLWTAPIAIAAGNTYILKPSERTPLSSIRIAELFEEAGLPPRRLQRRERRRRRGERDLRPPADPGRVLRRLGAGRQARLRALGRGREARPGARGRQEPHRRHAGRRPRPRRAGALLLGLLERGPALPGRERRGGRRLRRRRARRAARGAGEVLADRLRARSGERDHPGDDRAGQADRSPSTSSSASARARGSSSTGASSPTTAASSSGRRSSTTSSPR